MNIFSTSHNYKSLDEFPNLNDFDINFDISIKKYITNSQRSVLANLYVFGSKWDVIYFNLIFIEKERTFLLLFTDHNSKKYQVSKLDHIVSFLEFMHDKRFVSLDPSAEHIFNLFKLGVATL